MRSLIYMAALAALFWYTCDRSIWSYSTSGVGFFYLWACASV